MSTEDNGVQHAPTTDKEALSNMPINGPTLIPLKTTLETKTQESVIAVYFTLVPVKQASGALNLIRSITSNDDALDLQHLRRFAKYADVPEHVQASISAARGQDLKSIEISNETSNQLLLIIGATKSFYLEVLIQSLSPFLSPVTICSTPVPLLSPTSQEQASLWTSTYWPTVYKKSNPFGPHPSIVSRAEEEFRGDVEKWMGLAVEAAGESRRNGYGEAVGVVIVERRDGIARPVAVAGDARWLDWPYGGHGNVTAHAALRAIAMVAEGLKEAEDQAAREEDTLDIFRDQPIMKVEQGPFPPSTSAYLCHGLEIYCTHEPCVMCSMAILHSRFAKVVFQQRMPVSGGLCADSQLGHGLFWRKELNWQLLAWQVVPGNVSLVQHLDANINA